MDRKRIFHFLLHTKFEIQEDVWRITFPIWDPPFHDIIVRMKVPTLYKGSKREKSFVLSDQGVNIIDMDHVGLEIDQFDVIIQETINNKHYIATTPIEILPDKRTKQAFPPFLRDVKIQIQPEELWLHKLCSCFYCPQ